MQVFFYYKSARSRLPTAAAWRVDSFFWCVQGPVPNKARYRKHRLHTGGHGYLMTEADKNAVIAVYPRVNIVGQHTQESEGHHAATVQG